MFLFRPKKAHLWADRFQTFSFLLPSVEAASSRALGPAGFRSQSRALCPTETFTWVRAAPRDLSSDPVVENLLEPPHRAGCPLPGAWCPSERPGGVILGTLSLACGTLRSASSAGAGSWANALLFAWLIRTSLFPHFWKVLIQASKHDCQQKACLWRTPVQKGRQGDGQRCPRMLRIQDPCPSVHGPRVLVDRRPQCHLHSRQPG